MAKEKKSAKKFKEDLFVGIVGNPEPYYIFGFEYWLLPIIMKFKNAGLCQVRLHPQVKNYSSYLLKKYLKQICLIMKRRRI